MRMVIRSLMACVCFCTVMTVARAEERTPFVAGFERFARHGEIDQLAAGRLLITELSCVACHASDEVMYAPKRGPHLDGAAFRLKSRWLKAFIAAPHEVNPQTTMPDILGNRTEHERKTIASSIAAFLSTQNQLPADVKASGLVAVPHEFWKKGDASRGKELYHRVGCVACHDFDQEQVLAPKSSAVDQMIESLDADELAELGLSAAAREVPSVPLSDLTAKYTVAGLTHFLLDPHQFRKSSRMPALKLLPVEAADISSYLLRDQRAVQTEDTPDATEIAAGKRWFNELGCAQCHAADKLSPRAFAKPLEELDLQSETQCLKRGQSTPANYRLDAEQTTAIEMALTSLRTKITASQQLELQMLTFNCYACHERNGLGGVARFRRDHFETVASVDLGDEGRLPPPLTGVGRKLQTTWLKNVLLGKKADVRPHMQIRMPLFHTELASGLPELFKAVDALEPWTEIATTTKKSDLIEAGRQLMDVGCVQCHLFGGSSLPGVVGVDVRGIGTRVQPQWFREFLLDPSKLKTRTRMPSFFPDGKSQRVDLLDGNVELQIAAMWAYLNAKEALELPDKIREARSRNYELKPSDKPILLRTFMNDVGTHAIAVGFKQQVHFAFDAETPRLAAVWRGRFLDAQGTWFTRSAPPADPLGTHAVILPREVAIAELHSAAEEWPTNSAVESSEQVKFGGYRLDELGVPTFTYRTGNFEVEDRIEPTDGNGITGFKRQLNLKSLTQTAGASVDSCCRR